MWGEITEPPVKIQPTPSDKCVKEDQCTVFQDVPAEVNALLEAVVASGSQVKSQQIGDAELTTEERTKELLHQYRSKPLVFLERYHKCLKPEHLSAFSHVSADPRAGHYSEVIQRQAAATTHKTRVRNQRYAALRALQKGKGLYFSEEQMRTREPLLYEQYIGQYLTDDESMLGDAQQGGAAPEGAAGGLSHLLLNSYQERLIQCRLQEEQDREEGAREEEEEEEEEEDEGKRRLLKAVQENTWEPTSEEKALLREEFISQMHQRFLDGKDTDFNYSEVDENPDYDNLDIVNRDAEEKYFDEDDEEITACHW
uniref:Coiled-coil domain containing 97 n=1 Tax=Hippocampus comes TaxID=109280 RepID=A0A3Q2XK78_HIPCM